MPINQTKFGLKFDNKYQSAHREDKVTETGNLKSFDN